jgi:hypothetical protein
MALEDLLPNVVTSIVTGFVNLLPNLISALLILVLGLIAGKILGGIAKTVVMHSGLDNWVSKEKHIPIDLSTVTATLVSWVVYLLSIQEAADVIDAGNVVYIGNFIDGILLFVFGVIRASAVIVVGYSLGMYLKDVILQSKNIYADILGNIMFVLVLYLSIALALPSIGIAADVLSNLLLVVVASFGLGIAIAMGFGLKDVFANFAKKYSKKAGRRRR